MSRRAGQKNLEPPALELLDSVLAEYLGSRRLPPSLRRAAWHVAVGRIAAKDQANEEGLSYETVRARRNLLYRRIKIHGANQLLSGLLRVALRRLQACQGERAHAI